MGLAAWMFKLRRLNKKSAVLNLSRKKVNQMNIKKNFVFLIISLLMTFLLPNYANAALVFTFEAAGVQNTTVPADQVNVETFNLLTTGSKSGSTAIYSSAIGSFSGSYKINPADKYGGAANQSGVATNYITNNSLYTLSFPSSIGYFGLWWSAGDSGNILDITTVDNVVHTYTTKTLIDTGLLGSATSNPKSAYFGNPTTTFSGQNGGEPYAFLNFFATDEASKIKSITLRGTNFESDNYTTAVNLQTITGTTVPMACPSTQVSNATGTECITPVAPTVTSTNSTDLIAVPISGGATTSNTILSVTLKKIKDGLGATVTGATSSTIGTNLTVTNNAWTVTSGAVAVGTYTITAKDGNNLSGTGTFKVECLTGKVATATACITPPTVDVKSTTEGTPVPLTGQPGSSLTISSVTLTKFEDGLGAAVIDLPVSVGSNITSGQTIWTTPTPSTMKEAVGKYTITATDGNNKTGTNTLIVTCATGKMATASSCITVTNPTVNDKSTPDSVPVTLDGNIGTSTTISSVTLTKTKDGLGAAVSGVPATPVAGTPLSISSGTTWSISSGAVSVGTYTITVTDNYSKTATGTLTVTCATGKIATSTACNAPQPTVEPQTTFDTTPIIKGTVGTSALETNEAFTVAVNGKTYTNGVDANLVVSTLAWTLTIQTGSEIQGSATPYSVVATRGTAPNATTGTGNLTITPCTLPNVVNDSVTPATCSLPVPTVSSAAWNSNVTARVIHGTIGEVALGSTETFSVTIKSTPPHIYTHAKPETDLKITGMNWTLTIPATDAILAGTYDVEVARNATAKDTTLNELTITLVCDLPQVKVSNACVTPVSPTVNTATTTDKVAPTLTGTVGSSSSLTIKIQDSTGVKATGPATITAGNWTFTPSAPIAKGTYDVVAEGETGLKNSPSGELTVTMECTLPQVANTAGTACINSVPTVTTLNTPDTKPTIRGTVGTTQLISSETFSVAVNGTTYTNGDGYLSVSGTDWTLLITTELKPETYDVDAVRQGTHDETSGELVINDDIEVCIRPTTTGFISRSAFDSAKHDLGKCVASECTDPENTTPTGCTPPKPKSPVELKQNLPDQPLPKTNQYVDIIPPQIIYCDDGGVKSSIPATSPATGVTIKRAKIVNASTQDGTIDLSNATIKYGEKEAGQGTMDISNALIDRGQATGVTLTNVTLKNVFIDTASDYVDSNGNLINDGTSFIPVTGGTTLPTTTKEDGSITRATIFSGMITSGTDSNGNAIRGSATSGGYETEILNSSSVITQGRRTRGTLKNATITNARTTTVNGETRVDAGTITSGIMDSGALTFGTVINATLTNATISTSNTCFSSGTVGSRGQLNWKEVVK